MASLGQPFGTGKTHDKTNAYAAPHSGYDTGYDRGSALLSAENESWIQRLFLSFTGLLFIVWFKWF
jgi:hypothetical protein